MKAWLVVVLAVIAVSGLGIYHACNVYRVEAMRDRAFHRLDGLPNVRGTRPLTAELVRKRVVDWLGEMGLSVRCEDVSVRIAPVTAQNERQLPIQARKAIAIARKMPNHDITASVMIVDLTARAHRGWVTRVFSIHRTFLVKGPALPTDDGEGDRGEEQDDDEEP